MSISRSSSQSLSESLARRRQDRVARLAASHLKGLGGTLADTVGTHHRQRLVWLSLLAAPLLFPVALPGMASAVGGFCLLVAAGLLLGHSVSLPGWLARRELHGHIKTLLATMVGRVVPVVARVCRPRLLALTHPSLRLLNGSMLCAAGLAMMAPVPVISFDNVLPALAMVLMAWGLRLRDGVALLAGYAVTVVAVFSVGLLWWGGAYLVEGLISAGGSLAGT